MKMERKIRLLLAFLALASICALLPLTAFAAAPGVDSIQLGPTGWSTGLSEAKTVDLSAYKGSGKMSWDPSSKTITLDNAKPAANDEAVAVLDFSANPAETITLHLKGASIIRTTGNSNAEGFRFDTNVIITAEPGASLEVVTDRNGFWLPHGSLTVRSGKLNIHSKLAALNVAGDITIEDGAAVSATSETDAAVFASNGTVHLNSAKFTAESLAKSAAVVGRISGVTDTANPPANRIVIGSNCHIDGMKVATTGWTKASDGTYYADTVLVPSNTALSQDGLLADTSSASSKVVVQAGAAISPTEQPTTPPSEQPSAPNAPAPGTNPSAPAAGKPAAKPQKKPTVIAKATAEPEETDAPAPTAKPQPTEVAPEQSAQPEATTQPTSAENHGGFAWYWWLFLLLALLIVIIIIVVVRRRREEE